MLVAMILLSIVVAVIPTSLYVLLVWRLDRCEKEPLPLFFAAFFWGAVPAIISALVFELIAAVPFRELAESSLQVLSASLIAPPVEEFCKAGALLLLFWFIRSEFDGVLDGIVYASVIGFGFAMTENIVYFIGAWSNGGFAGWANLVWIRGIAFGLNHAMFTSFTGVALGLARYQKSVARRWLLFLIGLGAATLVHMLHNVLVSATGACLVGFAIDWAGILVVIVLVVVAWQHEQRTMRDYLRGEVTLGVINELQYETAVSQRKRLVHGWRVLGINGLHQARLWSELIQVITELAFKRHQQDKMGNEHNNAQLVFKLRSRIISLRRQLGEQVADISGI
ncbi:MAG: PrsW family intramembrane metalloprotease [Anaerolineae bacterium]